MAYFTIVHPLHTVDGIVNGVFISTTGGWQRMKKFLVLAPSLALALASIATLGAILTLGPQLLAALGGAR